MNPSRSPMCARPGENMTAEALDHLILHLKDCIKRMRSNSAVPENSSQVWEEYTSDVPGFLEALQKRQQQKVTCIQIAKDTALPLLKEVLEGIGSLHWVAFGCTMLAWGIDKLDKQHQNFEGCLDVLTGALFLVEQTRNTWVHEDPLDQTEGSACRISKRKHKHMMESILPQIADVAFTASAICVSWSPRKGLASLFTRCLGASTIEASISKLNGRIMMLGQQNLGIGQEQMMEMMKEMMGTSRPPSGYLSGEGEGTIGRRELENWVESMLKVEDEETVLAAVCLHGMGGVGKSTLAFTVFNKLLRQKTFMTCRVQMELESEKRDLPRIQEQILQEIRSQMKKRHDYRMKISNSTEGKERLRRVFKTTSCEGSTPILLYIDNVEDPEFLLDLLPPLTPLPMGLRLLITSRNAKASTYVQELGVAEDACHSIEVKTLDGELSRALLRKEALAKVKDKRILDSDPTLKALEDQVLRLCGGLPLALKIIGSHIALRAKGGPQSAETWRDVVNALKDAKSVEGNEQDGLYASLRVSINKLDASLRFDFFVLVTCMLRDLPDNMERARLEFIFGAQEMQNLIDRHLLEEFEEVVVDEDGRRSRVGCHDVIASLVKRMVVSSRGEHELRITQGAMWDQKSELEKPGNIGSISWMQVTDAQLRRMKRLRYAFEITVTTTISAAPPALLTKDIGLEDLRVLQIREGKSEGRLKLGRFPRLRVLFVEDGNGVELEDMVAPDLRELQYQYNGRDRQKSLSRCIHHFSVLQSLHLKVDWVSLPEGISMLTTLRFLKLFCCRNLKAIPDGISKFKALTELDLEGCESLQSIPEGIGQLTTLHHLGLRGCRSLRYIPQGISGLTSLSHLDLDGWESLKSLPEKTTLQDFKETILQYLTSFQWRRWRMRKSSYEACCEAISYSDTTQMLERTPTGSYALEQDEDDWLVGRRQLVFEVWSLLKREDDRQQKKVMVVLLHGMGGIGKSTLAMNIFEKLRERQKFVSCYVEMDLESEERDVPRLQEQIVQEIKSQRRRRNDHRIRIRNALHGREMLLREFKENTGKPILLCIDNVEHPQHLPQLLPSLTHLPSGSRLLITSRNAKANSYLHGFLGVEEDACHSIEVKTLDENLSRAILRKEALIEVENNEQILLDTDPTLRSLEDEVLGLCDGLPSALKLIGRYIASGGPESVETWRHVVSSMRESRPVNGNTQQDRLYARLRVSIDGLDQSLKRHFFDLVTYNLYERCDIVRLESIFGAAEMQELIDRHLLEVVKEDRHLKVRCHCIIASLVRRMESEEEEDIHELHIIQALKSEEENDIHELRIIHGLKSQEDVDVEELGNIGSIESVDVSDAQLRQMRRLRYAFDVNVRIMTTTTGGSKSAVVVEELNMPDLKVLEISGVKSDQGRMKLKLGRFPNLRVLSVKKDGDVVDLEDLMAPNLRELEYSLGDLESFTRCVHHFSHLRSLRLAVDWGNLPEGIHELTSLSHLDLGGCKRLQYLPEGISMLRDLRELHLRGCESLRFLPNSILELTSLNHLDLGDCKRLEALPDGISLLRALRLLDLTGCESLRCIPEGIHELTSLSILGVIEWL